MALNNGRAVSVAVMGEAKVMPELSGRNHDRIGSSQFRRHCEELPSRISEVKSRAQVIPQSDEQSKFGKLDDYLATLARRTDGLREDRVEECRQLILKAYTQETFPRRVSRISQDLSGAEEGFGRIPLWHRIKIEDFNADNFWWDFYWNDIGRGLVLSEKRHLVNRIVDEAARSDVSLSEESLDFSLLPTEVERMADRGHSPNVLIAPISTMVDFHGFFEADVDWSEGRPEKLSIGGVRSMSVFWSNRYIPLDGFIFFNSSASVWKIRPDRVTGNAITIALGNSQLYKDEVELAVETRVKYEISKTEEFLFVPLERIDAAESDQAR